MSRSPIVSVVMSAYNEAKYLPQAVNSLRAQTFADWELILFDDGSTDGATERVEKLGDIRVKVVRNRKPIGLTANLRRGVEMASGRYIARLDADDIALPSRLATQVAFFNANSELVLLGSACHLIDDVGNYIGSQQMPKDEIEIKWASLWGNPFLHPSVMLRRDSLVKNGLNYNEAFVTAQDFDLWSRLLKHGVCANLPEPLIYYRVRRGITRSRRTDQLARTYQIAARNWIDSGLVFPMTEESIELHWNLLLQPTTRCPSQSDDWIKAVGQYIHALENFSAMYVGETVLARIRNNQSWQIIRSLLYHHYPRGWRSAIAQLLKRDPLLPANLVGASIRRTWRRFVRQRSSAQINCYIRSLEHG